MSQRYVVLPRGINVGTRNRVRMADLRELLAEQGYGEIVTILPKSSRGGPGRLRAVVTS